MGFRPISAMREVRDAVRGDAREALDGKVAEMLTPSRPPTPAVERGLLPPPQAGIGEVAAAAAAEATAQALQKISAQLSRLQHLANWAPSGAWSACCLFGGRYTIDTSAPVQPSPGR